MATSSGKVTVTRHEVDELIEVLDQIIERLKEWLGRPEPRPVDKDAQGWPRLGWESHDDPEQNR